MLRSLLPAALRGQQRCAREDQAPHHILTPETWPLRDRCVQKESWAKAERRNGRPCSGHVILGQYDRL